MIVWPMRSTRVLDPSVRGDLLPGWNPEFSSLARARGV